MDRERLQREMEETDVGQESREVEQIQRMMDQRGGADGGRQGPASQHQQAGREPEGEVTSAGSNASGGEGTGLAGGRASGGAGRD